MVLVLAAVAAYAQYQKDLQEREGGIIGHDEEEQETTGSPTLQRVRHLTRQTTRLSQHLVHHAISRCRGGGDPTHLLDDDENDILLFSDHQDQRSFVIDDLRLMMEQAEREILPNVFRQDIRTEWIDAVFGSDFYTTPDYVPPPQGVGLANVPAYVTYQANIPAKAVETGDKVGVTLSRIALGLYVRQVEEGSEALFAGVEPGSVLVEVNGMGMLGEPSRNALERLWQYEGHFEEPIEENTSISSISGSSGNGSGEDAYSTSNHSSHRGPLALKFIKEGRLYTCIFLSNPPFGISWAPCGNFALVQRTHSFAAVGGVRRGCLIAAVNGRSMREMDHELAALEIRDLFMEGKEIELTLAYTPAASRTGFSEKPPAKRDNIRRRSTDRIQALPDDAINGNSQVVGYNMNSLWNCGADLDGVEMKAENSTQRRPQSSVAELALRVAAGEIQAPSGMRRHRSYRSSNSSLVSRATIKASKNRAYGPCPDLSEFLANWPLLGALLYCVKSLQSYDLLEASVEMNAAVPPLHELTEMTKSESAAKCMKPFLLQFVSVLCTSGDESVESHDDRELASLLMMMARRDENFSQELYFLLRSYTAFLEQRRQTSKRDESNRSLLSLLQALDRLRSAQRRLSSQLSSDEPLGSVQTFSNQSDSTPRAMNGASSPLEIAETVATTATASSIASSMDDNLVTPKSKKKKSSIKKLFRRKTPKESLLNEDRKSSTTKRQAAYSKSKSMGAEPSRPITPLSHLTLQLSHMSVPDLLENMTRFLGELDGICDEIERSMLKSFSQKIADWALQPWSASKGTALAKVTDDMRQSLRKSTEKTSAKRLPLVNPVESSEVLVTLDTEECYILPSAHFPLLLTFNLRNKPDAMKKYGTEPLKSQEQLYRTRLEFVALRTKSESALRKDVMYSVQAALAGVVKESGKTILAQSDAHVWSKGNSLSFDTRSSWGAPQTLSLRVSSTVVGDEQDADDSDHTDEVGFCWVDLKPFWEKIGVGQSLSSDAATTFATVSCRATVWSLAENKSFDPQGDLIGGLCPTPEQFELELRVTNEVLEFYDSSTGLHPQKRMLLYKHDDDLRQEMFAIQFIETCSQMLKSSGLDLKLLTFRCIPVGDKRGFIEWVPSSVPLSDICKPFAGSILAGKEEKKEETPVDDYGEENSISDVSKAGLGKYQSLFERLPLRGSERVSLSTNPIQDFLRSVAYDEDAPYLVRREVMDAYVKSSAGYCVLTYILGVGDRHLDNLLLHQSGRFFHCDFSFILGNDPKKYLPMRITEDMVNGMGGRESDNYAKFLSLAGAAFIALRRQENVRLILSMVRLMVPSSLPDVSVNQDPDEVVLGMRERLRLDLTDDRALAYMENLIETSITSKMWLAVDAIHTLGKRF